MYGGLPHKGDFDRHQYDFLGSFVDLIMIYDLLSKTYKENLISADSGHIAHSFRGYPHSHSGAFRTVRRGETLVEYIVP
jgi:hypothetical protein